MTKIPDILDARSTDTLELPADRTESVADFGKELHMALRPIIRFQRLVSNFRAPSVRLPQFDFAVSGIVDSHRRLASTLRNANLGPVAAFTRHLARLEQHNDALEKSGWLPHHSTPFELVDACNGDSEALCRTLLQFYEEHWPEVRQQIERRLVDYELDDEANATFREALNAHESGYYRCVCRVLPPEVERIARIELHGGKGKNISSQPILRRRAGTVRISSIKPHGLRGLNLLRRLQTHVYRTVHPKADRNRFEQDPVPNRHAALHGLVVYASMQNSLNSIFITEYIFQLISALKKTARLEAVG